MRGLKPRLFLRTICHRRNAEQMNMGRSTQDSIQAEDGWRLDLRFRGRFSS